MADDKKQHQAPQPAPRREATGDDGGGILRREGVEGGEGLSIGGGPPSAAGGTRSPSAPTLEEPTRK